jgi:hypothetical protein
MPETNERLSAALDDLDRTEAEIEAFEERLKTLKDHKNQIETVTLIDLYNELGVRSVTHDASGRKAARGLIPTGSLNKDPEQRKAAIQWLVDNGYEDVINVDVAASWARGDRAKAVAVYENLRRQDNSAKISLDEGVHWKTLGKIAVDRLTAGQEVPLTTLGIDVVSRVRFTKKRNAS